MAKKILAIVFGFMLAPAFITAQNTAGTSIVGSTCLVRVYHTNFRFPPEGGRIVQIGNEMFFWKTYLPECLNMLPSNTPVLVTSATGVPRDPYNLGGVEGNQLVGNPCAVRVYHTNFKFPEGGGKIIKVGNEMYFIRTYQAGCENAGSGAQVLVSSSGNYNPLWQTTPMSPTGQAYVDPSMGSTANNGTVLGSNITYQNQQSSCSPVFNQ
jgi:hypothetical protein